MLIGAGVFKSCDEIKEVNKEGTEITTKYVLYKKDGTEVVLGANIKKLSDIEKKITDLQAEKSEITTLATKLEEK